MFIKLKSHLHKYTIFLYTKLVRHIFILILECENFIPPLYMYSAFNAVTTFHTDLCLLPNGGNDFHIKGGTDLFTYLQNQELFVNPIMNR